MKRVEAAIGEGRCVLAISGALLRNADVMLALTERAALPAVVLSGPAVAPVKAIGDDALARVMHQPGGVVVVVEPGPADNPGLQDLAARLARGQHKPTILVVDRQFNMLLFGSMFRGIAVAHIKGRGQSFLRDLPRPPQDVELPEAVESPKKASSAAEGPKPVFVDREEQVDGLVALLGEGGTVVVVGPSGIGKRQLVEQAVAWTELARLPDLIIGWGSGFDTLMGRLAVICREAGHPALAEALGKRSLAPLPLIELAMTTLAAADSTAGQVMLVRGLHHVIGRDGDFFRKGRLELLVRELMTSRFPLRVVMTSEVAPVFHSHARSTAVRKLELGGIKGRFYHEIFSAYGTPDVQRDKFGPLSERLMGHPLAVRTAAVHVRDRDEGAALLDQPKFLARKTLDDNESLDKLLARQLEKIPKGARAAIARLSHLRYPVDGQVLAGLGVGRRGRISLLSRGLLEAYGEAGARRYAVHERVRRGLAVRERSDHDLLLHLSEQERKKADGADPIVALAHLQEASRLAMSARRPQACPRIEFPDSDELLESVMGLMRGRQPRLDLARRRLTDAFKDDPHNSEAHLLYVELLEREGKGKDELDGAFAEAIDKAPVPEVFHQYTNQLLRRKARNKAIEVMEAAVAQMPAEARLHTRLGALMLRQGRRPEALEQFRTAMELAPMLPDAYGLLGMARRDEGVDALSDVDELLHEAVRLAPEDPVQVSRLVIHLLSRARVQLDQRDALWAEAKDHLDRVIAGKRRAPECHLLLATLVRESSGDLSRARWLLKQAKKLSDRNPERLARIHLEMALCDAVEGKLDPAESTLRGLQQRDPSNHHTFAALAMVLEARGQLIPAHAELMQARERSGAASLERIAYEGELQRLQGLIEAAVAQYDVAPEAPVPHDHSARAGQVLRRAKPGEGEPAEAEAAAPEADAPSEADAPEEAQAPSEVAAEDVDHVEDDGEPAEDENRNADDADGSDGEEGDARDQRDDDLDDLTD